MTAGQSLYLRMPVSAFTAESRALADEEVLKSALVPYGAIWYIRTEGLARRRRDGWIVTEEHYKILSEWACCC